MLMRRLPIRFNADPKKIILLYLEPGNSDRLPRFFSFVDGINEADNVALLDETAAIFSRRHRMYKEKLLEHAERGLTTLNLSPGWNENQKLAFGSFLTKEYSVEAAALFNPSIVPHPDQSDLEEGSTRFVLTLRSVGEGHISSIGFMEGIVDADNTITFTKQGPWRTTGLVRFDSKDDTDHYSITFDPAVPLPERVIFPQADSESMGMEDLRMVKYEDGGVETYLGTYTAYNGKEIQSKMLETKDFIHFEIRNLKGTQVDNKGMAYFPRKIRGQYVMLSRQGGEKLAIMYSDDYMTWNERIPLQVPTRAFELVQIGNCGSPIETKDGWLMITHHVGPLRRYTLGVTLLDLEYPEKVLAILPEPLMEPLEEEREGYVPNVLYTCGWMQHGDSIIIPYAMSDVACGFAVVSIPELLEKLEKHKV